MGTDVNIHVLLDGRETSLDQDAPASYGEDEAQALIALGAHFAKRLPEVREALVNDLRARIKAGTYQQDSMTIAMQLLGIEEPIV